MRPLGFPRFSSLAVMALPVALLLSACVPTPSSVATTPEQAAIVAPVEPAETAYLSRADGKYTLPAVPLEKLPESLRRQPVDFATAEVPGTIVIHPGQKFLYLVTGKNKAIRYGISVGKSGFEWAGEAQVSQTKQWPTWTPPPEMIERSPKLAKWEKGQPGGPDNPLGARAIYLLTNGRDYGYRIHGTPDWWSIGRNASSGCIRMIHQDVIDLSGRIQTGTKVVVLNADGSYPKGLKLPPAPKKKAVAKPKPTPVAEVEPTLVVAPATPDAPVTTAPETGPQTTPAAAPLVPSTPVPTAQTTTSTPTVAAPDATVSPAPTAPTLSATPAPCIPGVANCPIKSP